MVRYVVDTGIFYRKDALLRLAETEIDVIVPAVVYMERVRQLRSRGLDPQRFRRILAKNRFAVEAFEAVHADRYATRIADRALWRRVYRDAMIAGHVDRDDVLWTTNPKDFLAVGLGPDQVLGL